MCIFNVSNRQFRNSSASSIGSMLSTGVSSFMGMTSWVTGTSAAQPVDEKDGVLTAKFVEIEFLPGKPYATSSTCNFLEPRVSC